MISMAWTRFLWRYLAYRKDLLVALLGCALVMGTAELSVPWLIKEAVDAVLGEGDDLDLDAWAALTLGILGALYGAHVLLLRAAARLIGHCSYRLRARLLAHVQAQALPFFRRHRTGELTHRLTSDAQIFEAETAALLRELPGELVVAVGVVALMAALHPGLALVVVAYMAAAAAMAGYLGRPLQGIRRSAQRVAARLSARFQESIAGVRTVQGFANE